MSIIAGPGSANGLAGALTILGVYASYRFGYDLPNDVVNALQTVINATFLAFLNRAVPPSSTTS